MLFDKKVFSERKSRAAQALNTVLKKGDVVLVHSGTPIQKPGGHDQTYPFLPHPDYFWLTGVRRPQGVSAYSMDEGWIDFILPVTKEERVWEGSPEEVPGRDIAGLETWLEVKNFTRRFVLGQAANSLSTDPSRDSDSILDTYNEVRRVKDAAEVQLIRELAAMSNAGYKRMRTFIRPGITERQIQLEYEAEVLKAGAEKLPYDTIVGAGTNAAVLHAIPTARVVQDGDLILIDAGADVQDYCVDVTRVFAANGKFDPKQQAIYDIVLKAQQKSIELMRPGVEWSDVHLTSAREISAGLRALGIIKCSADEALETSAVSLFFPHGVGHMVGLKVRDVGGRYNPTPKKYAGARLRVDLSLKEGYLMTVEPGLYFIHALLNDPDLRKTYAEQINWAEADKWMNVGGVRIEDDILITHNGHLNLTSVIEK